MPKALITGSAGFIGFHLANRLLAEGWTVTGLDAMTDYYDVSLKQDRHKLLDAHDGFRRIEGRLEDMDTVRDALGDGQDAVIHLAAQAGVRYSIDAPETYVQSNLIGTFNLLESVRHNPTAHLLMASTSSVYGANTKMPYAETDRAVSQMSFYAATKAANEAMAHSYAHLYDQPTTMFRFFTVYGSWGRPDMAYFKFTNKILNDVPIEVYNQGQMRRDFTFVDDLVEALVRLIDARPVRPADADDITPGDSLSPVAPFRVVNIGNADPVGLLEFIETLESAIGKKAIKKMLPMQPGDVAATWADTTLLHRLTGYRPATPLRQGLDSFARWYRDYY
jgi:UDP-glucuronate 4-epimerase